jgi:hypothetical protein
MECWADRPSLCGTREEVKTRPGSVHLVVPFHSIPFHFISFHSIQFLFIKYGPSSEIFATCFVLRPCSEEWNGMEWNGMEWNGMEWNGIASCNGTRWTDVGVHLPVGSVSWCAHGQVHNADHYRSCERNYGALFSAAGNALGPFSLSAHSNKPSIDLSVGEAAGHLKFLGLIC